MFPGGAGHGLTEHVHTWGEGPEVVVLSSPLADPEQWSGAGRARLLAAGYRVTTVEPRPEGSHWSDVVDWVGSFLGGRPAPVAVVGWSQGAAIAQEVALAHPDHVTCAALLATYGRQNELDRVLQAAWESVATNDPTLHDARLALRLLTSLTPAELADDQFLRAVRRRSGWAEPADPVRRRRAADFITGYQNRLPALAAVARPCLVLGFELDTDTTAARAREVAEAVPGAEYVEVAGVGHAAPVSHPDLVWPHVERHLARHHQAVR